jgi:thiol-disulfide isomerase/thioredoxin
VKKSKRRSASASPTATVIAALLAAIAGFATIYWTLQPSGNDSVQSAASGAPETQAAAPRKTGGTGPLAGLNSGEMAGLLLWPKPRDVPKLSLETGAGQTLGLADFKGKVVLLNLWASWCHPCREEMPSLDRLQAKLGGKDFQVVPLNIDQGGMDKPKQFLKQVGATHLGLYHDKTGTAFTDLHTVGMPTTLLLNRDGKEIGRMIGPAKWDSPDAIRLIKAAIADSGAKPAGNQAEIN